jgi:predicted  nucleic acid-binding Zn-ribbon protein
MQATVVQPVAPGRPDTAALHEWSSQLDQLRNDVFGIAMSVSALRDRIDRLEHRMTSDDQTTQSSLQKLRGEVEVWLENHLNAAVEHCMQRIISRPPAPVTTHAN